jgi:chromosome segregation ATPase
MSDNSYINYDAIKKDANLDGKKLFVIASVISLVFSANYVLGLNERINADSKRVGEITTSLASLQEQVNQNKQQNQEQLDIISAVTSTNTENITLLAENTNTKVSSVKRSIAAVSREVVAVRGEVATVSNDVVAVNDKVRIVEKKALSIEERTRAIEQAVDMPGANPLDSLITNYDQE